MENNKVRLLINGQEFYEHWSSVSITSELNTLARAFQVSITAKLPNSSPTIRQFNLGDHVQVFIGTDLVLSGYLEQLPISYNAHNVTATLAGRSKTCDLVDCSVMVAGRQIVPQNANSWAKAAAPISGRLVPAPQVSATSWRQQSVETIIAQLIAPYDIKLIIEDGDFSHKINHDVEPTETVHEALKHLVLKDEDLLFYDNENGDLIIAKRGSSQCVDALVVGGNVLSGKADFNGTQRFNEWRVIGQSSGNDTSFGKAVCGYEGTYQDPAINRVRYKCEQFSGQSTNEKCEKQARNKVRYAFSQYFKTSYTVVGWRQSDGSLWKINSKVKIHDPILDIDADGFLISKVVYSLDNTNGMTTTLEVMPEYGIYNEPQESSVNKKTKTAKTKKTKSKSDLSWINKPEPKTKV